MHVGRKFQRSCGFFGGLWYINPPTREDWNGAGKDTRNWVSADLSVAWTAKAYLPGQWRSSFYLKSKDMKSVLRPLKARRQDLAAGGPKTRGGPHFKNTVLDVCSKRGAKVKWGAPISNGGAGYHCRWGISFPTRWPANMGSTSRGSSSAIQPYNFLAWHAVHVVLPLHCDHISATAARQAKLTGYSKSWRWSLKV